MIHDKRDEENWSKDIVDWESRFDDGDIVIGDGYGSFRTMTMVHKIQLDALDKVVHRGVFWDEEYAEQFAEMLDNE